MEIKGQERESMAQAILSLVEGYEIDIPTDK